ncbi:hypothetical protein GCM10010191_03390 [Actinomadura vinacea]|uniref:Uncharacterized protein n=1 Tax=Actinomadura vinacea TaxID=115336 RepID=A0ABN3IB85_9ACTN
MTPSDPIIDEPGEHNFFMIGMETLFLSHMPMFTMGKHMYQIVLRASLPPEVMRGYQDRRRKNPGQTFNLVNRENDKMTLPGIKSGRVRSFRADLYSAYDDDQQDPKPIGPPFAENVPVTVEDVVLFRHFNKDIPRPEHHNYVVFGRGAEAHLTHYIACDPDFQHIVTLGRVPDWMSAEQVEASAELTLQNGPSLPVPCREPLPEGSCPVLFQGRKDAPATLDLRGAVTVWFSTANQLNENDPCAEADF